MTMKAEDQTLMLIKHPSLNQMIKLETDVSKTIKGFFFFFLWERKLINRFGCVSEGSCYLILFMCTYVYRYLFI